MWITVSCCVVDVTGVGWAARSSIVQGHRGQSFKVNLTHKIDQFFNIYIINKPKQKKWWRFGEERMGNACWSFLEMALDSMTPAHHFPTTKTPKKYRKLQFFDEMDRQFGQIGFFTAISAVLWSDYPNLVTNLVVWTAKFGFIWSKSIEIETQIWVNFVNFGRL